MAEQAVNFAASAVAISEFAGRAVSGLGGRFNKHADADEKLKRLELLLIKIRSAIETSEKHEVENMWLLQWRDKLKEAASEGDQVLAVFRERAGHQQGDASSSSSSISPHGAVSTSALSFTWNALSGMVQGIRNATNMIFCTDEDTEKLNSAVEKLEKLSPDLWEFIRLLQLEIMPKIQHHRAKKRKRPPPPPRVVETQASLPASSHAAPRLSGSGSPQRMSYACRRDRRDGEFAPSLRMEVTWRETMSEIFGIPRQPVEAWIAQTPEHKEYQLWTALQRRLMPAMCRISWAINMAADRDLDDSGGLAQWAAVLEEAHLRGRIAEINVKRNLSKYSINDGEMAAPCADGTDEVESLVRSIEILAGDVECFGSFLVLCPWDPATVSSAYCLLGQYQYSQDLTWNFAT